MIAFLLFWITKKKCDGALSTLSWLFPWDVTVLLGRRYCQTNPAFPSAGLHAFGLMDRVLWIVTECSMFNQYGSDLRMIFFVNANTILQFFFFYFKHFSFHCWPPALRFYWKARTCYYLLICHHLCIFWKVWDPQAQWSFLFETSAELGICMLYEVASVRALGMPEMNISLLPWADDAAIR